MGRLFQIIVHRKRNPRRPNMKLRAALSIILISISLALLTGCRSTQVAYRVSANSSTRSHGLMTESSLPSVASATSSAKKGPVVQAAAQKRLMIYTGMMALIVDDIADSMERTKKLVEQEGGYMHAMTSSSIVLKVPAAQFQDVVLKTERLGEVTLKEIEGRDVTGKMRDLNIRLSNKEEVRKRLVKLLERTEKVEDAIAIEKELGRITESIELMKGELASLKDQIAYSTLTVSFNSPVPQHAAKKEMPFPWVEQLAGDLVQGRVRARYARSGGKQVKFDLPKSFALYQKASYSTRAMSANDVIIKVQREENAKGTDIEFWATLVKRSLAANRAIKINKTSDMKIADNRDAKLIEGVKEVGGEMHSYLVVIAQTKEHVYTYEAWGEMADFEKARESIEVSIQSMDIVSFLGSLFE